MFLEIYLKGDGDDNDAADEEDDLINAYNDEELEADEDLDETLGDGKYCKKFKIII